MSPKPPVAVRAAPAQADSHTLPDPADQSRHHDDDLRDAVWLYQWSNTALRPPGETLATRLAIAG